MGSVVIPVAKMRLVCKNERRRWRRRQKYLSLRGIKDPGVSNIVSRVPGLGLGGNNPQHQYCNKSQLQFFHRVSLHLKR